MKKMFNITLRILIAALVIFLAYWFTLPAINVANVGFWFFLIFCIAVIAVSTLSGGALSAVVDYANAKANGRGTKLRGEKIKSEFNGRGLVLKIAGGAVAAIVVFLIIGGIIGWEIFNAKSYRDLMTLKDGDFTADVAELSMSQIPVVDRDSASRLGSRKLGEMSDLVSQFDIADDYTQINYKGTPARVTPLAYADIIKWAFNNGEGLPGYIIVDMVTQETELVRLDEGMKYSRSDILLRDLNRHLRFNYPTAMFDEVSFEIDDNGTPYWVASVIKYRVGIFNGKDIKAVVLCNAITGETEYYTMDEVPQWVDQAYSSDMILQQLYWHGEYVSGFWNSVFGQRDVIQPTEGYNYIAVDDDVWLYTGMTSVLADESNVGFVLINLRTKEGRFYSVPGAEEYSAMGSAEGQVQHLGYTATFPILLNVANRPTYFMALKDGAGLAKMYAFVDVEQYQIAATGASVSEAMQNYSDKIASDDNIQPPTDENTLKEGNIASVSSAVVNGNTKYYVMLEGSSDVYVIDVSLNDRLPFAKIGDKLIMTLDKSGKVVSCEILFSVGIS